MLTSVTLQNFKSFGRAVEVPLRPITVLVGANNSGKSNFLSLARFLRRAVEKGGQEATRLEGGLDFLMHRPPGKAGTKEANLRLEWSSTLGTYRSRLAPQEGRLIQLEEMLEPRTGSDRGLLKLQLQMVCSSGFVSTPTMRFRSPRRSQDRALAPRLPL